MGSHHNESPSKALHVMMILMIVMSVMAVGDLQGLDRDVHAIAIISATNIKNIVRER
jgi:hypothetical protein